MSTGSDKLKTAVIVYNFDDSKNLHFSFKKRYNIILFLIKL